MEKEDNRALKVFMTFGDIVVLNLAFIIGSIPIVTIGASMTALYSVTLKMVRKEDGKAWSSFWEAYKKNFKQATKLWLVALFALAGIYGEVLYIFNATDALTTMYKFLVVIEIAALCLVLPFLFPLTARYENTFWNTIKNSALLGISKMGSWVKVLVAWLAPIVFMILYPELTVLTWYVWLIFGFGLIGWGTAHTCRKVFDQIGKVQEEKSIKEAEEEKAKEEQHMREHAAPADANVASIREQMALIHKGKNKKKKK